MRFLFRVAFWLVVVVLLLPSDPDGRTDGPQVTFVQGLEAVRATVNDMSQFCARNPDLCATGEAVVQIVADKARYGIEQLQAFLDQNDIEENTLTADDEIIPWQGTASPPVVAGNVAN